MKWGVLWQAIRDVVLTCTGIFCIISQILARDPSGLLLGTGLALTVPSVAEHIKALLPSPAGAGHSSGRSSPPTRPPSPGSQQEASAGEQAP